MDKHALVHSLTDFEIEAFRAALLKWFEKNRRELPWRNIVSQNLNEKAYRVWISEVMLQQTQVATVINYYNKWVKKWPTVKELAAASSSEVNEMWSGLGYYSRAKRLHEASCKIVECLNGQVPNSSDKLMKLPGVGKYTAAAISSIVFNEPVGVVDGNVIRVLSRVSLIGGETDQKAVSDYIWKLSNQLVDEQNPGAFNEAMMELGATVCTPKSPSCSKCPVSKWCKAYKLACEGSTCLDVDKCVLCFKSLEDYDSKQGVMNFPRKAKKTKQRVEDLNVYIFRAGLQNPLFLICQRPSEGLLANLWEFVTVECSPETCLKSMNLCEKLPTNKIGNYTHIFSHLRHNYTIYLVNVEECERINCVPDHYQTFRWVTECQFNTEATSTAMKKIFKFLKVPSQPKKRKFVDDGKQPKLSAFFKKK